MQKSVSKTARHQEESQHRLFSSRVTFPSLASLEKKQLFFFRPVVDNEKGCNKEEETKKGREKNKSS